MRFNYKSLSFLVLALFISFSSFAAGMMKREMAPLSTAEFVKMSPSELEARTGEKMGFTKRLALRMVQNKLEKKMKKNPELAAAPVANTNGLALASLLLGVGGFFIAFATGWGLLLGAAGFILGIMALGKGQNKLMSILGIVFGAISFVLGLLFLVAISII
jgi:hypothetical protein